MQNTKSFSSNKKFLAQDVYPYGISRSGDFTRQQAELLEQHGVAYEELHTGTREPVNAEERRFVAVCKELKSPETQHELVWMKYYKKSKSRHLRAFSGSYNKVQNDNYPVDDDWAMALD